MFANNIFGENGTDNSGHYSPATIAREAMNDYSNGLSALPDINTEDAIDIFGGAFDKFRDKTKEFREKATEYMPDMSGKVTDMLKKKTTDESTGTQTVSTETDWTKVGIYTGVAAVVGFGIYKLVKH